MRMNLRTYQGNSMAEALEKVKQDLGRDAVILNTRTVRRGGLWGVGARTMVEITASSDVRDLPAGERRAMAGQDRRLAEAVAEAAPEQRAAGKVVPPIQGYGYRPPANLRATADRLAVGVIRDTVETQQAGGLASGRLMPSHPTVHPDFTALATGLRDEMDEIRSMVRELLNRPAVTQGRVDRSATDPPARPPEAETPAELQEYYTRLLQNAVAEEVAGDIIRKAKQRLADCRERIRAGVGDRVGGAVLDARIRVKLRELIPAIMMETVERMLPPPGPVQVEGAGGPKIVVLVGPTGVGKTTTIAKLAAQFKLREGRRVGLITTDTYRIAAIDQLRAYADIMSLPFEVVFTPEEFREAIGRLAECDLILVDTSGRSHRDTQRLADLRTFLQMARAIVAEANPPPGDSPKGRKARRQKKADLLPAGSSMEVHLLLSCTSDPSQLLQVADRFSTLGVDRAVFTKLDESVGIGVVLNVASRLNLQLSYLTTGQDVPDDIEVGHRRRIAEMLLKGNATEAKRNDVEGEPVVDQLA